MHIPDNDARDVRYLFSKGIYLKPSLPFHPFLVLRTLNRYILALGYPRVEEGQQKDCIQHSRAPLIHIVLRINRHLLEGLRLLLR